LTHSYFRAPIAIKRTAFPASRVIPEIDTFPAITSLLTARDNRLINIVDNGSPNNSLCSASVQPITFPQDILRDRNTGCSQGGPDKNGSSLQKAKRFRKYISPGPGKNHSKKCNKPISGNHEYSSLNSRQITKRIMIAPSLARLLTKSEYSIRFKKLGPTRTPTRIRPTTADCLIRDASRYPAVGAKKSGSFEIQERLSVLPLGASGFTAHCNGEGTMIRSNAGNRLFSERIMILSEQPHHLRYHI
jgi:hypothetical protein